MRIGFVIYGSLEGRSGGYLYDLRLVEVLRAAGHRVEVISQKSARYAGRLAQNLDHRFSGALAAWDGDIVIEDELNHPSLLAANLVLRRSSHPRPRIVALVHHLRSSERHPAPLRPFYRAVERSFLRSVDAFIFNSETSRLSVEALLGRAVPCLVAPPGGDRLDAVAQLVSETGRDRAAPSDARPLRVVFVGNLIKRKNLSVLLHALTVLGRDAWTLDVAGGSGGEGAYERSCRKIAAKLGDRVRLLGRIEDKALAELYSASDVLAVPSDHEGFGIVYLEAMRFGLVPIGADSGGAKEVIGEAGILVPAGDVSALAAALRRLALDPEERCRLAGAARERAARSPGWKESMDRITAWLESARDGYAATEPAR